MAKERCRRIINLLRKYMDQRLTGAGKLSRKVLTILSAVGILSMGTCWAVDNSIYIDQSGDNAIISITQDGSGNRVNGIVSSAAGQSTDAAKIYGDGTQVAINQVGAGNKLSLGVNRGIGSGTAANIINYSVTGDNAVGYIDLNNSGQATAIGNSINITQTGNNASASLNLIGNSNTVGLVTGGGANNSVGMNITGNTNSQSLSFTGGGGNTVSTTQTGDGNTLSVTSVGATNNVTVNQADGAQSATINNTGSGNQYVVNQSGTLGTNVLNISVAGSGSHITTTQTNR